MNLKNQMAEARQRQHLTHAAIASKLGIKPPAVTRILTRQSGRIPPSLLRLLDVLDLQLIAVPKEKVGLE